MPTRHKFILSTLVTLALVQVGNAAEQKTGRAAKSNIIYILTDDLGYQQTAPSAAQAGNKRTMHRWNSSRVGGGDEIAE
jgi:hypothetical protein